MKKKVLKALVRGLKTNILTLESRLTQSAQLVNNLESRSENYAILGQAETDAKLRAMKVAGELRAQVDTTLDAMEAVEAKASELKAHVALLESRPPVTISFEAQGEFFIQWCKDRLDQMQRQVDNLPQGDSQRTLWECKHACYMDILERLGQV